MRLAVQLYTLRAKLAEDVPSTLQALADAGAEEVELAGLYDYTAEDMRGILDAVGLKAASAHAPLDRLEAEPDAVLEEARALGVETVIVPWVPTPENDSAADDLVRRIANVGAAVRDAGFRFGYHNHAFEFGEVDLWSRIVESGLDLELDVGWLRVAGRDPVAELEQHAGRLLLVHAKDVRPEGDGWLDVVAGDGQLDFRAIARAAAAGGASHLVVELDTPSDDPVDDARRSLETLKEAIA
jgi:sugar phosphate isomerase/epimerase